ncbi:MAG: 2-polyprenyl-6-hydroxyphenyl methylase/3-demethylubiquinone-9 3-methyltransferase [Planctomycetota bacterium]|jgi:2-polyprenyl-6-hydroxyphenyl methylase/3-demethylubiquinone-9 3-methyltransferase
MTQNSTIDPAEAAYYARLANEWWDEGGKFWPLHRLNRVREAYLKQHICRHFGRDEKVDNPLQGLSMVDIGCGGGILAESMARLGATVTGIDIVGKGLAVAKQHSLGQQLNIEYLEGTAENLVVQKRRFDVVLNMEVVEHVLELPTFIGSCTQLLKPDGVTFIATINRNPMSWLFAIIGAEYLLQWLPRGTHKWSKFVKPTELGALLARDGLAIKAKSGVSINPFNKRFSLTSNLLVNYMLVASAGRD